MEILTSVRRLYISFKSLVNDFVYSFGHAALLLLVEVWNHTVPVQERRRIRVNSAHTLPSSLLRIHFNMILPHMPKPISSHLLTKILNAFLTSHACFMAS